MRVRCSSLPYAYHCPGWLGLAKKHKTESAASQRGTEMHAYLAAKLLGHDAPATTLNEIDIAELDEFWAWFKNEPLRVWGPGDFFVVGQNWECEREASYERKAKGTTLTAHFDAYCLAENGKVVIDWKTGDRQPYELPPIEKDKQMLGYGVVAWGMDGGAQPVTVIRVCTKTRRIDYLYVSEADAPSKAREVFDIVTIAAGGEFNVGPHCGKCYLFEHCDSYKKFVAANHALVPVNIGPELPMNAAEVGRFLVYNQSVRRAWRQYEKKLDEYEGLCFRAITAGLPVYWDGAMAKVVEVRRDKISQPKKIYYELRDEYGTAVDDYVGFTKTAATQVLKDNGAKRGEIEAWVEAKKESGEIEETVNEKIEWVRA